MGAAVFATYTSGENVKDAFNRLVADAVSETGGGGYTGTIAEKSSFVVIQQEPVSLKDARDMARRLIDDADARIDDKWGPAGAIALRASADEPDRTAGWLFFGWASE